MTTTAGGPGRVRDTVRLLHVPTPDRHVLVVGGGIVAARRVDSVRPGTRVVVVSRRICDDIADLLCEPWLTWENRDPRPSDLEHAWMVHIVSCDPAIDLAVSSWVHTTHRTWLPTLPDAG